MLQIQPAVFLLLPVLSLAAPPVDLDGLVELALARDPAAEALDAERAAALARAAGARRPMDPQGMVGVESLGSGDPYEPPMAMIGVTQMLGGLGEGAARADRLALDADRALAERARVAADTRTALWQGAARIRALQQELALLDEQVRSATAVRDLAVARYAAGADPAAGMPPAMAPMDDAMAPGAAPSVVGRRNAVDGMPGMEMDGSARGAPRTPGRAAPMAEPTAPSSMADGASGLAALLRLDAELARTGADRAGLQARLDGEEAVLAIRVGEEAAEAVLAAPAAFLGPAGAGAPERDLAAIDREAAEAEARMAAIARRPDWMIGVAERFMRDGMPGGTDVQVGMILPLWGARGLATDAAHAAVTAARAREAGVDRELALAAAQATAARDAAVARAAALDGVALPRARAGWDATLALFAAGRTSADQVVRAWETWLATGREAVAARRDLALRSAELARVENP